jgi:HK97 family phage major capsid protein
LLTLEEMRDRRDAVRADLLELVPEARTTDLSAEEATRFDELDAELRQLGTDIAAAETREARIAAVRRDSQPGPARIGAEPQTYGRGSRNSYFLDLIRAQLRGDATALDRLTRHAKELDVEMPRREARRRELAERRMEQEWAGERGRDVPVYRDGVSPFETRVAPNRTDGQGGYFIPPLWLIDEYIPLLRNGRPFTNIVRNLPLPGGTDSVNIPKVLTGTTTGEVADNGAVPSQDLTDTFITVPVRTIAGQSDVAMQLIDQSPIDFDQVIFPDLIADYNQRLDTRCLSGTGTGQQVRGVDNVSGINTVTYTDASPTLPELYLPLMQALSQVARTRKQLPTAMLWQSTRWFWAMSQLDTQNRPLVTPYPAMALNPEAIAMGQVAEGPVGQIGGFPIVLDQNIATNLGAGANQDRIYALRTSDMYLWEGGMRARTLTEVLSGTLQVRLQIYNYVAFTAERYPSSIATIDGTGLIAPSGF